jgi:hypothetical protein
MEHHQQRGVAALKLTGIPRNQWESGDCPLEECRNLVRVLASKTEFLFRECRSDQDKASQIRAMGSTLAALTALVNRLDQESGNSHTPDILIDARGFTYQTVRSCDLDRLSDK